MRLRTDSFNIAGWKRAHALRGCDCDEFKNHVAHKPKTFKEKPAKTGDVWKLVNQDGLTTGYALTCPNEQCAQGVHSWDHAYNCMTPVSTAHPSCWTWTGTVEHGDLSATPSLLVSTERGGCGWHGFLTNGEMRSV